MTTAFRKVLAVCTVVLAAGGCSPTAGHSWGGGGGSVTRVEGGGRVEFTIDRLTCDDRVYMVLAATGCHGSGGGGGNGTYRGQLHATGGREVAWSCATQDAKTGKVVIDGQEFDLAKGSLFLVVTKDTPARVEQLSIEAGRLQDSSDINSFDKLAKDDPRIAAFLETGRSGK